VRVARRLGFLALLVVGPLPLAAQTNFERGVASYQAGDYADAKAAWQAALGEELDELGRARVYHDLGNAHWRLEETLPAIACYSAAVRLDPRHADAWQNLELARAKAGLSPADPGDLAATLRRLVTSLRAGERRALLYGALLLWTAVLVLEMRSGGRGLRQALLGASGGLVLAAVPWAHGILVPSREWPHFVIASTNVPLRAEPLEARSPVGELAVLEEVERIDALPGWTRVERADGLRGWVRAETLYALEL
jgi:tetratricopeptide (TPR) repeat protein